jgi:hypothetical protein
VLPQGLTCLHLACTSSWATVDGAALAAATALQRLSLDGQLLLQRAQELAALTKLQHLELSEHCQLKKQHCWALLAALPALQSAAMPRMLVTSEQLASSSLPQLTRLAAAMLEVEVEGREQQLRGSFCQALPQLQQLELYSSTGEIDRLAAALCGHSALRSLRAYTRRAMGSRPASYGQPLMTAIGWACLAELPSLSSLELPWIRLGVGQGHGGPAQLARLQGVTSITVSMLQVDVGGQQGQQQQQQVQQHQQQQQEQQQQQGQHQEQVQHQQQDQDQQQQEQAQAQGVLSAAAPQLQQLAVHDIVSLYGLAATLHGHSSLASLAVHADRSQGPRHQPQLSTLTALTQLIWTGSECFQDEVDDRADAIAADAAACTALQDLRLACRGGLSTQGTSALAAGACSSSLRTVVLSSTSSLLSANGPCSLAGAAVLASSCSGLHELQLQGGWQEGAVMRDVQELREALQARRPAAQLLHLAQALAGSNGLAQLLLGAASADGQAGAGGAAWAAALQQLPVDDMEMELGRAMWPAEQRETGAEQAAGQPEGAWTAAAAAAGMHAGGDRSTAQDLAGAMGETGAQDLAWAVGETCTLDEWVSQWWRGAAGRASRPADEQQAHGALLQQLSDALTQQQQEEEAVGGHGEVPGQQDRAALLQGVQQGLVLRGALVQACKAHSSREVCVQMGRCKLVLAPPAGQSTALVLAPVDGSDEDQ